MNEEKAISLTLRLIVIFLISTLSGCCGWFASSPEMSVEQLEGSSDYPYRYKFTRTGSHCGGGHTGLGNIMPVFLNFPTSSEKTLTLSVKHNGRIDLSIPTYKIDYRGRATPSFENDDQSIVLEGNIFSLIGNSNEKGFIKINGESLEINLKSGGPFISGHYVDGVGSFDIHRSIDMRESLINERSSTTTVVEQSQNHTVVAIHLKSIRLDKGQHNSFFNLSDSITIFRTEEKREALFKGVISEFIQEGRLLSIYFDNNIIKSNLFGVIHSTLLNKDLFIDIGASQASINGTYTFN